MPELKDVLDDVQREVKAFGDNVKGLKDSMDKDLKSVRELAEKAGKDASESTQIKSDLQALSEGVAAKQDALEKQVKAIEEKAIQAAGQRMDEIERKLNRARLSGGGAEDPGAEVKSARDFYRGVLSARGELKADTDLSDEKVNLEEFKSYCSTFPSYLRRQPAGLTPDQQKAMQVGLDPSGGYFVSPTVMARILSIVRETSPMREVATVENVSSDVAEFPVDDDEADCGWVGENEDRNETDTPDVGVQRISVHEIFAQPRVTQRLLEDADFDVESYLGAKIGDKIGRTEASAFVAGDGVKKPKGFLVYPAGDGRGRIEQVNSGVADNFNFDSLINLMSALKDFYAAGAVWGMRRATMGKVMLLKDGEGRYIWSPNAQAGRPSVLLGHDVRQFADMPAVGAGSLPIAFGNFRVAYTIVDRRGLVTLRDPYTKKGSVKFYTTKRVGGDVTNFEAIKLMKVAAS